MENLSIQLNTGRKRYIIDDDESRVLEFNPEDLGIVVRLDTAQPMIFNAIEEFTKAQENADFSNDEDIREMAIQLKAVDKVIREQLDYIFDTNFSEVCAPHGTMLDPVNGEWRFSYLLDVFSKVYDDELQSAMQKRNDTIKKHTAKYTKKK